MRVKAAEGDAMNAILRLLTPENALVCLVCLSQGLRVGDALRLKPADLLKDSVTIREEKTGKRRKLRFSRALKEAMLGVSGRVWVFPHRTDPLRHRTRQAVYKDIRRAGKALRVEHLGTHSMRKTFAVRRYAACGDMRKVKALLNHSSEAVTMLYALAETIE